MNAESLPRAAAARERRRARRHLAATVLGALAALVAWLPALAASGEDPAPTSTESAASPRYDIREYTVEGNTVLTVAQVRSALSPWLGPNRSTQDIDAARDALLAAYRARGYQSVAVFLDPRSRQTVADGEIVLRVEETRIGTVTVTGARWFSPERIRARVPSLAEGEVPDFDAVQREVAALGTSRDRHVTPAIRNDARTGALDVDLAVDDALPLHGMLEYNNRYSKGTTHTRAMLFMSWDNLWQRGHSLSLMRQTAPERPDDGTVTFASWVARFDDTEFSLQASVLDSESDVASVGGILVIGRGHVEGLKGTWPLRSDGGAQASVSATLEHKDFTNRVQVGASSIDSPIEYFPLTLSYSGSRRGGDDALRFGVDLMTTLPGTGSPSAIVALSRYRATRQLRWLRASAGYESAFAGDWQYAITAQAQATDLPLVSNEQASAGGMDSVRGYLEAEASADSALRGSVELRTPLLASRDAGGAIAARLDDARAYVFVDAARLEMVGPLPNRAQADDFELCSAGAGLRVSALSHANAVLEYALPLVDGSDTQRHEGRLLFRLFATF